MVDTKLKAHGIDTSNVKLVFPQKKDGKDIIPKHINASTCIVGPPHTSRYYT
ncbi:MAG: hypothetical protein CM15mV16_1610 [uncultured marine virus]|nr:MAG: hypothetical protein CM15mV16_1610 [uncultured marine virus]